MIVNAMKAVGSADTRCASDEEASLDADAIHTRFKARAPQGSVTAALDEDVLAAFAGAGLSAHPTVLRMLDLLSQPQSDLHACRLVKSAAYKLLQQQHFVRVQYDPLHTGDGLPGTGDFVDIPLAMIQAFAQQDPDGDDGVELAFTKVTKQDCMHITGYSLEQLYDGRGNAVAPPGGKLAVRP